MGSHLMTCSCLQFVKSQYGVYHTGIAKLIWHCCFHMFSYSCLPVGAVLSKIDHSLLNELCDSVTL